jgi:uncharacterized membrane protein YcaP (DUF421 family)
MGDGPEMQGLEVLMVHDMFALGAPLAEKVIRPLLVYLFLIVAFRAFGKRVLAQLNPFDLVVLLILSNTVQNAIIGSDNSVTGGLVSAVTLFAVNAVMVRWLYGHQRLEQVIEGEPDALIANGQLLEARLKKNGISKFELAAAAHKQGFESLGEVDRAVLEPGGAIWFFRHTPTADEARQQELLDRLERIERRLERNLPASR